MSSDSGMEKLKYPIGRFAFPTGISADDISLWISQIADLPENLGNLVSSLSVAQLDTPYRPHGWTVRQLVNHIGDSHLNSLIRFKLALTEDKPTIKPYDQDAWATLKDFDNYTTQSSLEFINQLHKRFVCLLRSLSPEQLEREFVHPEMGTVKLKQNIALYAWHGKHHCAHISELIKRSGW